MKDKKITRKKLIESLDELLDANCKVTDENGKYNLNVVLTAVGAVPVKNWSFRKDGKEEEYRTRMVEKRISIARYPDCRELWWPGVDYPELFVYQLKIWAKEVEICFDSPFNDSPDEDPSYETIYAARLEKMFTRIQRNKIVKNPPKQKEITQEEKIKLYQKLSMELLDILSKVPGDYSMGKFAKVA